MDSKENSLESCLEGCHGDIHSLKKYSSSSQHLPYLRVSVAMTRHQDQKQVEEEKVYLAYLSTL